MYFQLYDLLSDFLYGSDLVLTEWMEMVVTVLATVGVLFVFAIPFVVVWSAIKVVVGLCGR